MAAISEVQDPQQCHLVVARGALSAQRRIEPAPAELRLPFRTAFPSITATMRRDTESECARLCERSSERLSAGLRYSAYSPLDVRIKQPTGRLKPGEQYCRSS